MTYPESRSDPCVAALRQPLLTAEEISGVSVVICCHNSAARLIPTLCHLARQDVPPSLGWEVLVVDNGSTDGTAEIARQLWPAPNSAPLRVIHEPKVGLSNARLAGIAAARYEAVSFVDDDNWLANDWIRVAAEILAVRPEVGACGGVADAVSDGPPPPWFSRFQGYYAAGAQASQSGDVTESRGWLWGAGLTLRTSAVRQLISDGFRPILSDRRGTSLISGGDIELCLALRLAGWRLWYDDRLQMKHYMPAGRLEWQYFRRLCRGSGASTTGRDPYQYVLNPGLEYRRRWKRTWQWQLLSATLRVARHKLRSVYGRSKRDNWQGVVDYERSRGRLGELLHLRRAYTRSFNCLARAPWLMGSKGEAALGRQKAKEVA